MSASPIVLPAPPAPRQRVVFTTSDIQGMLGKRGQKRVSTSIDGTPWYSRGRLETAFERRLDTWVVTSRPRLGDHDDWWLRIVGLLAMGYGPGDAISTRITALTLRHAGRSRVRHSNATGADCEAAAEAWRNFVWNDLKLDAQIPIDATWQEIEAMLPSLGVLLGAQLPKRGAR